MKAEELFLAIGEVESSRLTRSELTTARPSGQREQEEPKMKNRNVSRILRNLLVAALIDALGWMGQEKVAFGVKQYLGVALMLGGVVLFKLK